MKTLARPLEYGSVCSGIEAVTLAWQPLGLLPAWFSEIDPFANAVLAHHYPLVRNLGDMTCIAPQILTGAVCAPDILVGGTPCQSFSIAGMRQGLADPRGTLTLTYVELANAIDHARTKQNQPPAILVWENVPGVLSDRSNAFGCFLGALVGEDRALQPPGDKWTHAGCVYGPQRSAAWRVLDAQYFGLAQRRRRVFLVASARHGFDPAAVLFESDSMRRDSPPSPQARQKVAGTIAAGIARRSADDPERGALVTGTLPSGGKAAGSATGQDAESGLLIAHSLRADGFDASEDGTGRGTPLVPICFDETQITSAENRCNPQANDPSHPLVAGGRPPTIAFDCKASGRNGFGIGEIAPTLRAMGHKDTHSNAGGQIAVAFQERGRTGGRNLEIGGDISYALTSPADGGRSQELNVLTPQMAVRRLTPRECERLQGFPEITNTAAIIVCKGEAEKRERARSVEANSALQGLERGAPAAVCVQIDLERLDLRLLSHGRLLWSASIAESRSSSHLRMPSDNFARLVVPTLSALGQAIRDGRVESHPLISTSSVQLNGSAFALLSGQEIDALVGDAGKFTAVLQQCLRFATSRVGHDSASYAHHFLAWCCCVAAAISSCIPETIRSGPSYWLRIETVTGYTFVPYRGKPAADGPRYKAIGNSMAVRCVRWIGQRLIRALDRSEH